MSDPVEEEEEFLIIAAHLPTKPEDVHPDSDKSYQAYEELLMWLYICKMSASLRHSIHFTFSGGDFAS